MAQELALATEAPPRLPTIQAGGTVRAIVPQDFDSAWRIANAVAKAGMAPRGLETAEKAMVAIMHGLEVGLTPMNALQSIAVVNGRPTIWGDGAIGLVRGSGLLEWMEEKFEGVEGADGFRAVCAVKRKTEPKPVSGSFSIADAKKAGLWGKQGPWQQYPKRMLQMRARAFALRDGFADVLKGLSIKEEVEDYTMRDVTPRADDAPPPPPPPATRAPPPPPASDLDLAAPARDPATVEWVDEDGVISDPPTADHPAPEAASVTPENTAEPAKGAGPEWPEDPDEFLDWVDTTLGAIANPDELETVWNDRIAPRLPDLFPPDRSVAEGYFRKHEKRLGID